MEYMTVHNTRLQGLFHDLRKCRLKGSQILNMHSPRAEISTILQLHTTVEISSYQILWSSGNKLYLPIHVPMKHFLYIITWHVFLSWADFNIQPELVKKAKQNHKTDKNTKGPYTSMSVFSVLNIDREQLIAT